MGTEGDKPNLEIVSGGAGEGAGADDKGVQDQTTQTQTAGGVDEGDKRTAEQVKADDRAVILDSLGVKSAQDLADLVELSKLGYAKIKADYDAEQEDLRNGQVDEAKELSKTQFFSKYGGQFTRTKEGHMIVSPNVLHQMFEDNKVEAAKIADQVADNKLTARQKEEDELRVREKGAYNQFWSDPGNKDLLEGTCLDDQGNEVRAADEVNALVNSRAMKPSQAAYTVRRAMKAYKVTQEKFARETDRVTRQYEGNWHEDIPENELPSEIRRVRPNLQALKKKPEGERGSDAFFDAVVEAKRTWS